MREPYNKTIFLKNRTESQNMCSMVFSSLSLLVFRFLSSTLYLSGISVLKQDNVFNSLKEKGEQLSHGQYFVFFRKQCALEINIILYCVEKEASSVCFSCVKEN